MITKKMKSISFMAFQMILEILNNRMVSYSFRSYYFLFLGSLCPLDKGVSAKMFQFQVIKKVFKLLEGIITDILVKNGDKCEGQTLIQLSPIQSKKL